MKYLMEVLGQNGYFIFTVPIDIMLQKGHSYQKYHLTKVAPNINGISQKSLVPSMNHTTNSRIPFKNHIFQPLAINLRAFFFASCVIFLRNHFLWVSYLSISGGVFIMNHFCKVPLFSNSIKGYLFCWVPFLLVVSDGANFVFS